MPDDSKCPKCGRDIPPDTPGGQCPYCLLHLGAENSITSGGAAPIGRDRNLLFGVLALQLRFVRPQEFLDAAAAWSTDPTRNVADRLIEAGALDKKQRDLIEGLVQEAVQQHDGDEHRTFETFGGESILIEQLSGISAPENARQAVTRLGIPLDVEDVDSDDISAVMETPGRYSRKSEYSRGGMGRILLVHDEYLSRDIALKELIPPSDPSYSAIDGKSPVRAMSSLIVRFLREAKVTGQLEHPSIVPVYELGRRPNGTLYYTMKLVRGQTLAQALRTVSRLEERLTYLSHYVDLCQAVGYAHSRNVIHRDIKPSNVMIGEFGETVVIDWGLAKVIGQADIHEDELRETWSKLRGKEISDPAKTAPGTRLGTPYYMAPEQAKGHIDEIDQRTDVFSLGAVLYEVLTGRIPFDGKTSEAVFQRVVEAAPRPVRELTPDAPPELASVCAKAMQKDPDKRYRNAKELADDVQRFLTGAVVHAYEYSPGEVFTRFYKRHRALVNATAAALIVILGLGVFSYINIRNARDRAEAARKEAVAALVLVEKSAYDNAILVASHHFRENRMAAANEVLAQAPASRRGWEWGYLYNLCNAHLASLPRENYAVNNVAYSSDGRYIATSALRGTVKVWDAASLDLIQTMQEPEYRVADVQFSPDGRLLAVSQQGSRIILWDYLANTARNLDGQSGQVTKLAFPSNSRLVSASTDGSLVVWDVATGTILQRLATSMNPDTLVTDQAQNLLLLTNMKDAVRMFRFGDDGQLSEGTPLEGRKAFVSSDGRYVAVTKLSAVEVYRMPESALVRSFPAPPDAIRSIVFSEDRDSVAIATEDGNVIGWNLQTGERAFQYRASQPLSELSLSLDGAHFTAIAGGRIETWPHHPNAKPTFLGAMDGNVISHAIDPSGKRLITGSNANETKIWAYPQSPAEARSLSMGLGYTMAVAPAGDRVAATMEDGFVHIVNLNTLRSVAAYKSSALPIPQVAAWSPDGRFLACSLDRFNPVVINTSTNEVAAMFTEHAGEVLALAWHPDGDRVASGSWDNTARLWDASTGIEIQRYVGHSNTVKSMDFNSAGDQLVTASEDGLIIVWSAGSGDELRRLEGHTESIRSVRFSPGDDLIISGSIDRTARVWDAATGEVRATLAAHSGSIADAFFSEDMSRVFTFSNDGTVIVWAYPDAKPLLTLEEPELPIFGSTLLDSESVLTLGTLEGTIRELRAFLPSAATDGTTADEDLANAHAAYKSTLVKADSASAVARQETVFTTAEQFNASVQRLLNLLSAPLPAGQFSEDGLVVLRDSPLAETLGVYGFDANETVRAVNTTTLNSPEELNSALLSLQADAATSTQTRQPIQFTVFDARENLDVVRTVKFLTPVTKELTTTLTASEALQFLRGQLSSLRLNGAFLLRDSGEAARLLGEETTPENPIVGLLIRGTKDGMVKPFYLRYGMAEGDMLRKIDGVTVQSLDTYSQRLQEIDTQLSQRNGFNTTLTFQRGAFAFIQLRFTST